MTSSPNDDWVQIHNLRSNWSWHYDSPDMEALLALFTDDAVLDYGPYGRWVGPEERRAGYAENVGAPDNHYATLHAVTNPVIEVDGDTASGRWFLLDYVLTGGPEQPALRTMGVYHDTYRREAGRWLISGIRLDLLWNSDLGRMAPGEAKKLSFHADA